MKEVAHEKEIKDEHGILGTNVLAAVPDFKKFLKFEKPMKRKKN